VRGCARAQLGGREGVGRGGGLFGGDGGLDDTVGVVRKRKAL
jgi:hypothetical protein